MPEPVVAQPHERTSMIDLEAIDEGEAAPGRIPCWNPGDDEVCDVPPGKNDPRAGRAAHEYLKTACWAAQAGAIDAITTAPLSKAALRLARRAGGGSVWGARLDPLTDKILISAPLL